ncbi:L-glutaminase [Nonlabens sp. Hel1_33_55]|uniref:glutaminase n=1 Tax=Nonlabens sp. Hel1_33_55 TaxID=1336802 RepID=UPI000875B2CE|nr:glutaminase [Nonlabens sp. Hel1_33_55]SCY41236.1 L-glutaminase [Nonlabens sp. Hel1_33_55]
MIFKNIVKVKQMVDYQKTIEEIHESILREENKGEIASYIPELAQVNPEKFGIHLLMANGKSYGTGDSKTKFSIQSISKVLSLTLAYKSEGDSIWKRVGVEPSGNPYNSLVQLEDHKGKPRNPLINAGALVICDILVSKFKDPAKEFLDFVHSICSKDNVGYDMSVAKSEKSVGYRNIALCYYLKSFDNIENDPEEVLDFYFTMCSLEMSCENLSRAFMFLVKDSFKTTNNEQLISPKKADRINAIMQTCGFYDESGEFAFMVGLPGKSGVGGGIVALHPEKYCIAVWSPLLNKKGNSYRGMKALQQFTTKTESTIF